MKRIEAAVVMAVAYGALMSGCTAPAGSGDDDRQATSGPESDQRQTVYLRDDHRFHPSTVDARVGQVTLTFELSSQFDGLNVMFDSKTIPSVNVISRNTAGTVRVTFTHPGTYTFHNTSSVGADGKIVVR